MSATIQSGSFCLLVCYLKIKKTELYRDIILPLVLCGRDNSSVTLREGNRQRLFESRVLRKVFGSKTEKVGADWRKLRNEELYGWYLSTGIVRVTKTRRLR
jgi:hypothetical protein